MRQTLQTPVDTSCRERLFRFMRFIACFFLLIPAAGALAAADQPPGVPVVASTIRTDSTPRREMLTNEGIVLLSDAGFSDSFIVEKILLSRTRFDVSAEGLAYLRNNAISEELVRFIL